MTTPARQITIRALKAKGDPKAVLEQTKGMLTAEIELSKAEGSSREYLQEWQELLAMLEKEGPQKMLTLLEQQSTKSERKP